MKWIDFKVEVERQGINDDDDIDCIDVCHFDKIIVDKTVETCDDGSEVVTQIVIR